jgi:threonine dehydrogenase-like Zn-dependent dehydrogenase
MRPTSCEQREFMTGAQAPLARVPLADGTLVGTAELPPDDLIPSLLAASDVLADAARVQPGSTVVVVGDGAVGLMGVLAAKQMGAGRIVAMSRHKTRQDLALEFGATDIISERGDDGVARIKDLTIRHHLPLVLCRQAPTRGGAPHFGSRRAHVRCDLAPFPAKPDHAEERPRSARIPLS